ncbi:MAG: LysR family transcriptional regulator [Thermodesulfobacteriota bacterium]|nr:LysR family transcriptional regulator [Thermodesulfobacteriota bacterium]
MNLHLFSLKVFCTVVEKKSFSKASRFLCLTQPAVSLQVKSLEEYFDTRLLNRTKDGVKLTEPGEILYRHAKQFSVLIDDLKQEMSRWNGVSKSYLNIGACIFVGGYILPRFLANFKKKYPEIEISLTISNASRIIDGIISGSFHVGWICNPTTASDKGFVIEEFGKEPLSLISPSDYDPHGEISLGDLAKERFVMIDGDCGSHLTIGEYFRKNNINLEDINIVATFGNSEAIKTAVEEGMGLSIVPQKAISKELKLGTLKETELKEGRLWQNYYLVYTSQQRNNSPTDRFLNYLRTSSL